MCKFSKVFSTALILFTLTPFFVFSQTVLSLDDAIKNCNQYLQERFSKGKRVALIAIQSENQEVGEIAYRKLSTVLVNSGWFKIVERNAFALDSINQEIDRHLNAWVSEETELSIGKQLGAEIIISGIFNKSGQNWQLEIKATDIEKAQIVAQWSADVRSETTWSFLATPKNAGISFEGDTLSTVRDRQTIITGLRNAIQTNRTNLDLDEKLPYGIGYGFTITIYLNNASSNPNLLQAEVNIAFLQRGRVLFQSSPYYITETTETLLARRIAERLRADKAFFNNINENLK